MDYHSDWKIKALVQDLKFVTLTKVVAGQGSECSKHHVLAWIRLINGIREGLSGGTHSQSQTQYVFKVLFTTLDSETGQWWTPTAPYSG